MADETTRLRDQRQPKWPVPAARWHENRVHFTLITAIAGKQVHGMSSTRPPSFLEGSMSSRDIPNHMTMGLATSTEE